MKMQSRTVTTYQRPAPSSPRRLGPVRSPVVSCAITRKANEVRASSAFTRAAVSILMVLLLLVDCVFGFSALLCNGKISLLMLQCSEIGLGIIFFLNFLHDFTLFMSILLMQRSIPLTPKQSQMLGIKNPLAEGYELVSEPVPFGEPAFSSTPMAGHTSMHPPHYMTPMSSSPSSAHSSHSNSAYNSPNTPHTSLRGQSMPRTFKPSPSSPFSKEPVADAHSLKCYLKQEEEKEQHFLRGSMDLTPGQGSYGAHQLSSHTPSPRKYHIAPRSNSPSMLCHGELDSSHHHRRSDTSASSYSVPGPSGIQKGFLDRWTERCRKWIALSIVKPLAEEIGSINSILSRKGVSEQIGTVSINSLKHIAKSKSQHLPTLSLVIPYLEVSPKQEYLVDRIKELAQGSYLSAYRWNSGGNWKGRMWSIDLPNDSQIVMHLLSTYLDTHLPPDPWFPDGKTFSTQYFLKAPPKNGTQKQGVCIVQDNNHPPTYKVLVKGKCIEVSEGRNNLFHSICIFLHHVKEGEKSMLGSINLETAGINILSIISQDKSHE